MITYKILHRSDAGRATHYYGDQVDDYYSRDAGAAVWQGEGARRLGATGNVDIDRFHAMLRGQFGGDVVAASTIRKDAKARAAIDLTISAPKSISLQALIGKDEQLVHAHDAAAAAALDYAEQILAMGRHKEKGKARVERTGNLIIAKFRHETARPTENAPPDPQLHTHAVIMNLTQRADGRWVALSNEDIVALRRVMDAIYMAELDRRARDLGYDVRYEKDHIELAHITRDQIDLFSKRRRDIDAGLAARGLDRADASHGQRQATTLATRKQKDAHISRDEAFRDWVTQSEAAGIDFERPELERSANELASPELSTDYVAQAALRWAISHHAERESVMPHADLLEIAVRHAGGFADTAAIGRAIQQRVRDGELIQEAPRYRSTQDTKASPLTREGWAQEVAQLRDIDMAVALANVDQAIAQGRFVMMRPRYATRAAYDAETRILDAERLGRGVAHAPLEIAAVEPGLAPALTAGQRDAVMLITTGNDQISGIQGLAGTGKSFALQNTRDILEGHGKTMVALAPYGGQVRNLRSDGIDANTIASVLTASDKRPFTDRLGPDTIVVIDEAGVVPVRQLDKLLALIQPSGAKVVLLGDTSQTKAIEAGRAFAMLQENGMKTVLMGDIQRQRSERLKKAVELAAGGQASKSLPLLDRVMTVPDEIFTDEHGQKTRDSSARYTEIAQAFTALPEREQSKTLIVTGTNASRRTINHKIHEMRGLAGKGVSCQLLARHDTTRAQRSVARYYTVGDIVQPERDYKCGLKRGELYRVTGRTGADRITVAPLRPTSPDLAPIEIMPKTMSKLSVYQLNESELSVGDLVRVNRNDAKRDLVNGQVARVAAIDCYAVTLDVGGRNVDLPIDGPLQLDYAYTTTAHSAQGLTCDRVFYNAESFSRTTAQDTYYVGISRERHEVVVFTDDATKLPAAVDRVPYKGLAHDVASPKHAHDGLEKQIQKPAHEASIELE